MNDEYISRRFRELEKDVALLMEKTNLQWKEIESLKNWLWVAGICITGLIGKIYF